MLQSFDDVERSQFIRFAWGRTRLPRGRWEQHLTISRLATADGEESLPVAHTCFFQVELPPYSSEEKMREKLCTTIHFGLGGMLLY